MKSLWILTFVLALTAQTKFPWTFNSTGGGAGGVLQASDFTYLGNFGTETASQCDTVTSGGISGRTVGGVQHLFTYCQNYGLPTQVITGISTTSFTYDNTSLAQYWTVGDHLRVWMAANGSGSYPENTIITSNNTSTGTVVFSPALSRTPATNDTGYTEGGGIEELVDPGVGNYHTGSAFDGSVRATQYALWADPYHGKRISWDQSNHTRLPSSQWGTYAVHWDPNQSLLFWSYADGYAASCCNDWQLGAASLDNVGTGATTSYGPWRVNTASGPGAFNSLLYSPDPTDSTKLLSSATFQSGSLAIGPWGPSYFGGVSWPGTSTPAGLGNPNISTTTTGLRYYYMGDGGQSYHCNTDGTITGAIRSFHYTSHNFDYVWEAEDASGTSGHSDNCNPAATQAGGFNTWNDTNRVNGFWDIEGVNRKGVVYFATLTGKVGGNSTDCFLGSHEWYSTGAESPPFLCPLHGCNPAGGSPTGPTMSNSGASPSNYNDNNDARNVLLIYDPADLAAVNAGTKTDYTVEPTAMIDIANTWHSVQFMGVSDQVNSIAYGGVFYNPTTKLLYLAAHKVDKTFSPYQIGTIFHVWSVNDSALPMPFPTATVVTFGLVGVAMMVGRKR